MKRQTGPFGLVPRAELLPACRIDLANHAEDLA